jgi:uncharacterized membrane protein
MESRTKLLGHPIHQMLIVFPLGLLATSLILDIVYLITDSGKWAQAAFYDMGIGILGGLLAALCGSRWNASHNRPVSVSVASIPG